MLILEEEETLFGKSPWAHGMTRENKNVLEKFLEYAEDQGYISYRPKLAELFTWLK